MTSWQQVCTKANSLCQSEAGASRVTHLLSLSLPLPQAESLAHQITGMSLISRWNRSSFRWRAVKGGGGGENGDTWLQRVLCGQRSRTLKFWRERCCQMQKIPLVNCLSGWHLCSAYDTTCKPVHVLCVCRRGWAVLDCQKQLGTWLGREGITGSLLYDRVASSAQTLWTWCGYLIEWLAEHKNCGHDVGTW